MDKRGVGDWKKGQLLRGKDEEMDGQRTGCKEVTVRIALAPPSLWQSTASRQPSTGIYFQRDMQMDSLGPQEASPPSPTPRHASDHSFPFSLCLFPLPLPKGQRAAHPRKAICYQPVYPRLFTLGLQLTESPSQIN